MQHTLGAHGCIWMTRSVLAKSRGERLETLEEVLTLLSAGDRTRTGRAKVRWESCLHENACKDLPQKRAKLGLSSSIRYIAAAIAPDTIMRASLTRMLYCCCISSYIPKIL